MTEKRYPLVPMRTYWEFIRKFDAGDYTTQRFGQAFFNCHLSYEEHGPDPELFYATDRRKAEAIIEQRYLAPLE